MGEVGHLVKTMEGQPVLAVAQFVLYVLIHVVWPITVRGSPISMELQLGGQSLPVRPTRPELWAINDIKSARLVLWAEANYEQVFCASFCRCN